MKKTSQPADITIYTDGGSRNNPGPAGAGVWIKNNRTQETLSLAVFLGKKTNNEAEYLGLLAALKWLEQTNLPEESLVQFYLDSKLVTEQIQGHWKVRQEHLQKLVGRCHQLMEALPYSLTFSHVKREKNKKADSLANLAMDLNSILKA